MRGVGSEAAIAANVSPTDVVAENEDDVGLRLLAHGLSVFRSSLLDGLDLALATLLRRENRSPVALHIHDRPTFGSGFSQALFEHAHG